MIGVTKAELYPAFSLSGTFGFLSTDIDGSSLSDAFKWSSRVVSFGPAVVWNVFNYGQITNQVRHRTRLSRQAVLSYQNTVLQAQQEVEDALASFLGAQDTVALLAEAVAARRGDRSSSPRSSTAKGATELHHRADRAAKPARAAGSARGDPGRASRRG